IPFAPGNFAGALDIPGSGRDGAQGAGAVNPTPTALTIHGWAYLRSHQPDGILMLKEYRNDGTWSPPYVSLMIGDNSNATWFVVRTTGGVFHELDITASADSLPLNQWFHVAMTYDGSTLTAYLNGVARGSMAVSGNLDFGTNGPYGFGSVPPSTGS